jgi:hypothetical protein
MSLFAVIFLVNLVVIGSTTIFSGNIRDVNIDCDKLRSDNCTGTSDCFNKMCNYQKNKTSYGYIIFTPDSKICSIEQKYIKQSHLYNIVFGPVNITTCDDDGKYSFCFDVESCVKVICDLQKKQFTHMTVSFVDSDKCDFLIN